jgi:hypothetical protein
MENLLESNLIKAIADPGIDIVGDLEEFTIDSIFASELLKEIPVINTLLNLTKIGVGVNNFIFTKKLIRFLQAIKIHSDDDFREKYKSKILANQSLNEQIAQHLLEIINRIVQKEQIKVLANLLLAFIHDLLTWDDFQTLTFMLSQAPPVTMHCLEEFAKTNPPFSTHQRPEWEALLTGFGFAQRHGSHLYANEYGKKLYTYGIKQYGTIENRQQ